MRLPFAALLTTACLLAFPTFSGGLGEMTPAERAIFREEVKAFLIENPEVITEALDVLQTRQDMADLARDQQLLADNAAFLFNDANSWVGGNPDGDITVVEFMDYRCGYCRKAKEAVEELVKSDGNIRFVLKEFPILGDDSVASSRFAVAVLQLHGPDAYKAAHDALIMLRGSPDAETLGRLAADLGIDPAPVLARMNADEVTAVLAANRALADVMSLSGTPAFAINKTLLRGYVPLDGLRAIVADERAG